MKNIDINIIGAGNVAWHLAHRLFICGYKINSIFSLHSENAERLAHEINASVLKNITDFQPAMVNILSIKDEVYNEIITQLPHCEQIFVHTSGSIDTNVLACLSDNFGVFYPFQTFSKNKPIDFSQVPICIEASNEFTKTTLTTIANDISTKVYFLTLKQRSQLHLAGVFASNFTNALYGLAEEILMKENIDFDIIKPLIKETANKIELLRPYESQTGPAARKDWNIINKHIAMLDNDNKRNLYRFLTQIIQEQQKKHHSI